MEEVFAHVSDVEHDAEWGAGVTEVRKSSEGSGPSTCTCATFWAADSKTGTLEFRGRMDCEPADGGTRVIMSHEAEAGGIFKLGEPVLQGIARRRTEHEFQTLKAFLEAGGGEAPAGG